MKKEDRAKSISAKLSKISRATGINYQGISTTFLLERLLARLVADGKLAKSLVFKGGYVFVKFIVRGLVKCRKILSELKLSISI